MAARIRGIMAGSETATPATCSMLPVKPTNGLMSGIYCWRASATCIARASLSRANAASSGLLSTATASNRASSGREGPRRRQRAWRRERCARRCGRRARSASRAVRGSVASSARGRCRLRRVRTSASSRSVCPLAGFDAWASGSRRRRGRRAARFALDATLLGRQGVVEIGGPDTRRWRSNFAAREALARGTRLFECDLAGGHHLGREGQVLHGIEADAQRRPIPSPSGSRRRTGTRSRARRWCSG